MKRVLFLDIDGVLNSDKFLQDVSGFNDLDQISPANVACLNFIQDQVPDMCVVITSTWRVNKSVSDLQDLLTRAGARVSVIDKTADDDNSREKQISDWVDSNFDCKFHVVVDDMDLFSSLPVSIRDSIFVRTDVSTGLTMDDAKKVISLFMK